MIFQMKISIWPYRRQKPKVFRWHGPITYSKKAGVASALYNLLFPKMDTAISHAKTVFASFNEGTTPAKAESATTVFALAEQLRVYM